jgi:hypothetical protein
MQAILRRARDLGKITESKYKSLYILIGKQGYRTNEPVYIPSEEPVLLKKIIEVHQKDHGYSVADLARVLTTNEFEETYLPREEKILRIADFGSLTSGTVAGRIAPTPTPPRCRRHGGANLSDN